MNRLSFVPAALLLAFACAVGACAAPAEDEADSAGQAASRTTPDGAEIVETGSSDWGRALARAGKVRVVSDGYKIWSSEGGTYRAKEGTRIAVATNGTNHVASVGSSLVRFDSKMKREKEVSVGIIWSAPVIDAKGNVTFIGGDASNSRLATDLMRWSPDGTLSKLTANFYPDAPVLGQQRGLVADESGIYGVVPVGPGQYEIRVVPPTGGEAKALPGVPKGYIGNFAVTKDDVFFVVNEAICRIPKAGGTSTKVAVGKGLVGVAANEKLAIAVAIDGDNVDIRRLSTSGGAPKKIGTIAPQGKGTGVFFNAVALDDAGQFVEVLVSEYADQRLERADYRIVRMKLPTE